MTWIGNLKNKRSNQAVNCFFDDAPLTALTISAAITLVLVSGIGLLIWGQYHSQKHEFFIHKTRTLITLVTIIIVVPLLSLIWAKVLLITKQHFSRTTQTKIKRLEKMERQRITNSELQNIISVISHDLRTPLVSAHGFSDLLIKYCKSLSELVNKPELKEHFDKKICETIKNDIPQSANYISKSLEEMDGLIAGLTNISRAGTVKISIENIEMNKLASQVADAIRFQTDATRTKVIIEDLPDCKADKFMLNEVFINLLANAVKFLEPQRKGIIKISGKTEGSNAIYCIKDNGIGIKMENQSKVFELFYREKPGNFNGEGIGLAFALRAINRLGGEIWVESEPEKGSCFFITLPAVKPFNTLIKEPMKAYKAISDKKKDVMQSIENISCLNPS